MKHTLTSKAAELMRKNGRHRRWRRAFSGMAAVVVFITTYMLILPAITMENKAICGMAEHTHTDACYEMQLVCTQEETPEGADVHVHGPECYEQQQVLTCTKQEGEGHAHTDACYGYVCGQEESSGHTHTDACYTEVTHRELTCTEPESAGHSHGDGCYDADGNLVCTEPESTGHTHGDSCYTETVTRELTCGQEESSGHTHTDACIGLICGQEAYEGHTHTDACYTTEDVLVCTEPTGHTHGDGCYEKVLVCDVPEHTHTEACYPAEEPQEPELICTLPEHSHEDACYDADGNLICGLEEHTHTEECYAPVEIPEEETPTTAFPEEIPEGYKEYTFDNEAGLTMTAYAPEGAFGQDVQLFAEVLSEDSEEYAQAKENLDKAENAPEYTGMAAMDIRFVDAAAEDPAVAEEIEPDAEMGQVFVKIDAQALIPEDVDESTLAVQHHAKVSDGGIFGTGIFEHTDVVVETVADNTEETGDITAVPDETALPETLPALADEPEMAEAATLEEPAAETETEETQPAAMNVEAEFAVNSFSTFTITWQVSYGNKFTITVHYVDEAGEPIDGEVTGNKNVPYYQLNDWVDLSDYNNYDDADQRNQKYIYLGAYLGVLSDDGNYVPGNVDAKTLKYSNGSFYYRVDGQSNETGTKWSGVEEYHVFLVYKKNNLEVINGMTPTGVTVNFFDYTGDGRENGINKNHNFNFIDDQKPVDVGYNKYTGQGKGVLQGIIQNTLVGNYPQVNDVNRIEGDNLSYLFRPDENSADTTVQNVKGLFLEKNGYYYYDSGENFAELEKSRRGSYTGNVILYNLPRGDAMAPPSFPQFLPFNSLDKDSVKTATNDYTSDPNYGKIYRYYGITESENYHFGMTINFDFLMPRNGQVEGDDMIFRFEGDDDVWVFIDGKLALDMGGIHDNYEGYINFATGEVWVERTTTGTNVKTDLWSMMGYQSKEKWLEDWELEKHRFNFYYLERGAGGSNCRIEFNMPTMPESSLLIGKELTAVGNASEGVLNFVENSLEYSFRVLKVSGDLLIPEGTTYDIWEDGKDTGEDGTVKKDGIFTLKAGQQAVFGGILANSGEYYVQELINEDFTGQYQGVEYEVSGIGGQQQTDDDGNTTVEGFMGYDSGTISAKDESTIVTFYNKVDMTKVDNFGSLQITKNVTGDTENKTFYVKVEWKDGDDWTLVSDGTQYSSDKKADIQTVTGGKGIIPIEKGETINFLALAGTGYRITEVEANGDPIKTDEENGPISVVYGFADGSGEEGDVPGTENVVGTVTGSTEEDGTFNGDDDKVTITNNYPVKKGNLSITKMVARTDGVTPSGSGFQFELTLNDGKTPSAGITGTFDYTVSGNITGKITFANGEVTGITGLAASSETITGEDGQASTTKHYVKLDHDQTITIQDLPGGTVATIKEINYSGYAPTWKDTWDITVDNTSDIHTNAGDTVTTESIAANDPIEVTCTNTTGAVLPSTGGMGTTPFLALGTLLTLGAGMLLVQRRRKEGSDAV